MTFVLFGTQEKRIYFSSTLQWSAQRQLSKTKTTAKINYSVWRARRAAGFMINAHAVLWVCTSLSSFSFISCLSFHVCLSVQCWEAWNHVVCWGRSVTCWRWFWRGWTACPNSTTPPPPTHGAWMSSALLSTGTLSFYFFLQLYFLLAITKILDYINQYSPWCKWL